MFVTWKSSAAPLGCLFSHHFLESFEGLVMPHHQHWSAILVFVSLAFVASHISAAQSVSSPLPTSTSGAGKMALQLSSTAFSNGGDIPVKYTCDGNDVSPALSWSNA